MIRDLMAMVGMLALWLPAVPAEAGAATPDAPFPGTCTTSSKCTTSAVAALNDHAIEVYTRGKSCSWKLYDIRTLVTVGHGTFKNNGSDPVHGLYGTYRLQVTSNGGSCYGSIAPTV